MYALKIDTRGMGAQLRKIAALPEVIEAEMLATTRVALDAFEQAVKLETPVGVSGNLRAAMTWQIETRAPADITGIMGIDPNTGGVTNPLAYAQWMEDATRNTSAMPPTDALELWVVRVMGLTGKAAQSAAFAIARKIQAGKSRHQKRGGARMFEKGFKNAKPHVIRLYENLPARVVKRMEAL